MEDISQSSQQQSSSCVHRTADGEQRSEATITFVIPTLSKMEGAMLSRPVFIRSLPWHILVVPQDVQSSSQGANRNRTVGVFVQCIPNASIAQSWSVSARVSIALINHLDSSRNHTKVFQHCFCAQSTDWGYTTYMKWKHLVDPTKGYSLDDTIKLQAHITAEEPQGISPPMALSGPSFSTESSGLSCPVCYEDYQNDGKKRPMSLKCGHTFCLDCLQRNCSSSEGQTRLACSLCKEDHTALGEAKPWFPNYSIVHLIGNVIPKSRHFCEIHHHEKCYYCLDDKQLVCIYCAYHGEHASHNCEHVDKAKTTVGQSLWKMKLKATGRVAELGRSLQVLKDEQETLKSQESHVCQLVEDLHTNIASSLRKQRDSLLEELKAHTGEIGGAIAGHIRELEEKSKRAVSVIDAYAAWQGLPTKDALAKSTTMESQLKALSSSKDLNTLSTTTAKVSFETPYSNGVTSVDLLGRITITPKDVSLPEVKTKEKGFGEEEGVGERVAIDTETGPSSGALYSEGYSGASSPGSEDGYGTHVPPAKRQRKD